MPERLRRTIRGLEKMFEPLRYQFDDLDKQVRRRPAGIDLVSTMEILHKNMARIEQELALMRERVDMELLLRNDSLADENLPLPGDTPPPDDDSPILGPDPRDERAAPVTPPTRTFAASGNPFELPTGSDQRATRVDDRTADETLLLKPVKLGKNPSGDQHRLPPASPQVKRPSGDEHGVETPVPRKQRSSDTKRSKLDDDPSRTRRDRSEDDTLVVEQVPTPS